VASIVFAALLFGFTPNCNSQEQPQRDAQAVAIVQQSLVVMGGTVANDSVATGAVVISAGENQQSGSVRILTKGITHCGEEYKTGNLDVKEIYADGIGVQWQTSAPKEMGAQWAFSAQTAIYPAFILASILNNADSAFEYVGVESIGTGKAHHVRAWNTFASHSKMKGLAEFTIKEIWIDSSSLLPVKVAFERRDSAGASPRIPVEVRYADYRNVGGVVYPHAVEKYFNGSLWATVRIVSVSLNSGLTYADFPTILF
jgi:hypothetical protein